MILYPVSDERASPTLAPEGHKNITQARNTDRVSAIASILMAALPILAIALVGFVSGPGLA